MHDEDVPTKTISLELDAYDKLRQAKRTPRESFSSVVRRATWKDSPPSAAESLAGLRSLVTAQPGALLDSAELNRMARRRRSTRKRTGWED